MRIDNEEIDRRGAFRAFEGEQVLGSMVWVRATDSVIYVQHTGVEPAAQGKGVGKALFEHLVAWARETGTTVRVQCPYTHRMFRKHPEMRDVLG